LEGCTRLGGVVLKVEYYKHMGDDLFVANVARVSFDKESKKFTTIKDVMKGSDEGVINFLARENHWSPFAHPHISLRMGAPVPIRTQCFKHKVGFVENEESRRYISSTPEIYIPDEFRSKPVGSIKQGSGGVHSRSDYWRNVYKKSTEDAVVVYLEMVRDGVCPEQARFVLPQGAIVNWIWTGSLMAYARVYQLRSDSHAQMEVQVIADKIDEIIRPMFPYCWEALTKKWET